MFTERKKLVGIRKATSKKGTPYATLYFIEKRNDVIGEAASNTNVFVDSVVKDIDVSWVGKEVNLIYSVNYANNSVFLIDVQPVTNKN